MLLLLLLVLLLLLLSLLPSLLLLVLVLSLMVVLLLLLLLLLLPLLLSLVLALLGLLLLVLFRVYVVGALPPSIWEWVRSFDPCLAVLPPVASATSAGSVVVFIIVTTLRARSVNSH